MQILCGSRVEWFENQGKVFQEWILEDQAEIIQRNRKVVSNQEDLVVRNRDLKSANSVAS